MMIGIKKRLIGWVFIGFSFTFRVFDYLKLYMATQNKLPERKNEFMLKEKIYHVHVLLNLEKRAI